MLAASFLLSLAGAASPPSIRVRIERDTEESVPQIATWQAGEVRCGNGKVFPAKSVARPFPVMLRRIADPSPDVVFTFDLQPSGRATSIEMVDDGERKRRTSDLAPALAASRFGPVETHTRCTIAFSEQVLPLAWASLEDLVLLRSSSPSLNIPAKAWEHHVPGNCHTSSGPQPLVEVWPDFRKLRARPGRQEWTAVSFDTNADGAPINVDIMGSSGAPELDDAGLGAVKASRWIDGGRVGCVRYFWTGSDVVPAPEPTVSIDRTAAPEACDAAGRWTREPRMVYPKAYRRRGIEGWAVLRYDVAPWGEIGNIEVLDAQPAAELGRSASAVLRSARFAERSGGLSGCIETVRFVLPTKEPDAVDDGAAQD